MAIEIWSIDASKFGFAAYGYSTAAAHSDTINHYGIGADDGLDAKRLGGIGELGRLWRE